MAVNSPKPEVPLRNLLNIVNMNNYKSVRPVFVVCKQPKTSHTHTGKLRGV